MGYKLLFQQICLPFLHIQSQYQQSLHFQSSYLLVFMDLQATTWHKPSNSILQNPKPQFISRSHFKIVQLNTQKQPQIPVTLQPSCSLNLNSKDNINLQKSNDNLERDKQDSVSSVFSSSQSDSSSQESESQNIISKTKKTTKKSDRNNNYRKYSRITPQVKERLIYLIARQNMSIKQASVKLKINYSSAKFIFSQYRDRKLQIIDRDVDRGEITDDVVVLNKIQSVESEGINGQVKMLVKCSSGGKFEAESEKTYGLREILQLYTQSPYIQSQGLKIEV